MLSGGETKGVSVCRLQTLPPPPLREVRQSLMPVPLASSSGKRKEFHFWKLLERSISIACTKAHPVPTPSRFSAEACGVEPVLCGWFLNTECSAGSGLAGHPEA